MSFLAKVEKVEAANDCVHLLVRSLYAVVGNKRFMHDIERLLEERLKDLDGMGSEAVCMLARALRDHA